MPRRTSPSVPADLGQRTTVSAAQRTRAVNLLEQAGTVITDDHGRLAWVDDSVSPRRAVHRALDVAATHEQLTRSRIEMMRGYAETTGCRRQFLLGYFGEQLVEPCGNCDTCEDGTAQANPATDSAYAVNTEVSHEEWGRGIVMSSEEDRLTVLFEEVGYKTLALAAVQERQLLSQIGE